MARVFQREAEDIEKELEALENQEPENDGCTIKKGDKYYCVDRLGRVYEMPYYNGGKFDKFCIDSNNSYKTEEGAENHRLRLLSMKPKYSIDELMKAERVYIVYPDVTGDFVHACGCYNIDDLIIHYNLGRVFLTKKERQEWINTYGPAWLAKDERWLRYE